MTKPPETPKSENKADLKFVRQPMVRWFDPVQLAGTGIQALISGIFGSFADKREIQAALHQPQINDYTAEDENEIWIDYIADLGDGWNSTYTMAKLLAQPELDFDGLNEPTKRGRVLVMGGDQVYPTATREEYNNRMVGPYQAALPWIKPDEKFGINLEFSTDLDNANISSNLRQKFEDNGITLSKDATVAIQHKGSNWAITSGVETYTIEKDGDELKIHLDKHLHLFAIPGNHDWYDGLTSFTRLFSQERWIGAWQTRQRRSYFALKLPHRWWLWGIDVQLQSDIDQPQLNYFEEIAQKEMEEGDRVILCTAEPSWVYTKTKGEEGQVAYEKLKYFERRTIHKYGGKLALTLAGDLHHYCRYEEATPANKNNGRQKITAGGGGAFLYGTHEMPETLILDEVEAPNIAYSRNAPFPTRNETFSQLIFGSLLFPFKNWRLSRFVGGLYLLFTWLLQSATETADGPRFMQTISELDGLGTIVNKFFSTIVYSPGNLVFVIAIIGGLISFSKGKRIWRFILGFLHAVAHLFVIIFLIWAFGSLNPNLLGITFGTLPSILAVIVEMILFGGILGGLLMGIYLLLSNLLLGVHTNEIFSALKIQNYKNFLRLHIDKDGLTIYPIGVRKVCKNWDFQANAPDGDSWFEPQAGNEPKPELLEDKIKIETI
ncbi:hypothetical protein IH992_16595 [Candidatus Poribacteria bacterium]|nr:hypothetical protein [Candidatus Poribacteria bacterium]